MAPLRRARWGLRRLASAGLAAGSLAVALQVLAPGPPPGVPAVVLTHDLGAGTVLSTGDLRQVSLPADVVPRGALTTGQASGRVLAGGVGAGEVLTDGRLAGAGLLTGQPGGRVAAPVRVADAGAAALAQAGRRVDVLVAATDPATGSSIGPAQVVVTAVTVLAAPAPTSDDAGLLGGGAGSDLAAGGLLVLAVSPAQARDLAGAAARGPLMIMLR